MIATNLSLQFHYFKLRNPIHYNKKKKEIKVLVLLGNTKLAGTFS